MKHIFFSFLLCLCCLGVRAQEQPIYLETFDRCLDAEDENYGYTGGNDEQWGGDIAKAQAIYQDSPEWTFNYCNGAYQCLKVGTSNKQGSATTPAIECEGEVVLTFRVAPWEGDSLFYLTISGGQTTDSTVFELKQHRWRNVTVHITDISSSIKITFSSLSKHRFFLDDVCVRPMPSDAGVIRTAEGSMLDFGLLGRHYSAAERTLHISAQNLTEAGITASLEYDTENLFTLSSASLPAAGGELRVTCAPGAAEGTTHGAYLWLRGKDKKTGETVEKRITLMLEVASLDLEGSGTRPDPYTCSDVILLAENEGTVWTGTYYWATGYVLGAVKRYNDQYDGVCTTDKLSLVLADSADETDDNHYVTVQISGAAREALNVVDNPELIGQRIKVQGLLLNDKANPMYLSHPGVRNVVTDDQYERPAKDNTALEETAPLQPDAPMYDILGRPVGGEYRGIIIQNGHKYIR